MHWIKSKRLLIPVVIFIGFGIGLGYSHYTDKLLEKSDSYTIGTISKISGAKGGLKIYINFEYRTQKYQVSYIDGSGDVSTKNNLGKRYFVKIIPEHPTKLIEINYLDTVPAHITTAPPSGWTGDWLKKRMLIE